MAICTKHNMSMKNQSTNEHSFTEKVKGVKTCARKLFHHNHHGQKPSGGGEKKYCIVPRIIEHMKRRKNKKVGWRSIDNTSDAGSSTDSDSDTPTNKVNIFTLSFHYNSYVLYQFLKLIKFVLWFCGCRIKTWVYEIIKMITY